MTDYDAAIAEATDNGFVQHSKFRWKLERGTQVLTFGVDGPSGWAAQVHDSGARTASLSLPASTDPRLATVLLQDFVYAVTVQPESSPR